MQTECSAELLAFAPVGRREVVGSFDGGAITSDAGALLLRATDRAIGLVKRFSKCFAAYSCSDEDFNPCSPTAGYNQPQAHIVTAYTP